MTDVSALDADQILRPLLALVDSRLRVAWLDERIRTLPAAQIGPALDHIIGQSEVAEPKCREALMTIALWTAGLSDHSVLQPLRRVAVTERLLSLQRVIRTPPRDSQAPEPRKGKIPDYGKGRELTLGERRSLARCSDRSLFDSLLRDPHPMVIHQLLINPRTVESDVVQIAAQRPAHLPVLQAIAQTPWLSRRRVRLAILFNPASPLSIALPLIGLSTRDELVDLSRGADLHSLVRVTATQLLDRRPPIWRKEVSEAEPIH